MKSLFGLAARLRSLLSGQQTVVARATIRHDVIDPLSTPAFKRTGAKVDVVTGDKAA